VPLRNLKLRVLAIAVLTMVALALPVAGAG